MLPLIFHLGWVPIHSKMFDSKNDSIASFAIVGPFVVSITKINNVIPLSLTILS